MATLHSLTQARRSRTGGGDRVGLSLRPDSQSRHLPAGFEAALNSIDDILPRQRVFWCSTVRRKSIFQERLPPLLKRHLVDARRDPVTLRLHVIDLFVDRQRVKSRRRQGQRTRHVPDYTTGSSDDTVRRRDGGGDGVRRRWRGRKRVTCRIPERSERATPLETRRTRRTRRLGGKTRPRPQSRAHGHCRNLTT